MSGDNEETTPRRSIPTREAGGSEPAPDDESVSKAAAEQRALPEPIEPERGPLAAGQRPLRIVAVTGARGGAGRTVIASNLALYLSTIGRKVILVDADPSGANLHTVLGMRRPISLPRAGRLGARRDGTALIEEVTVRTPHPGLRRPYAAPDH